MASIANDIFHLIWQNSPKSAAPHPVHGRRPVIKAEVANTAATHLNRVVWDDEKIWQQWQNRVAGYLWQKLMTAANWYEQHDASPNPEANMSYFASTMDIHWWTTELFPQEG